MSTHVPEFQSIFRLFASFCIDIVPATDHRWHHMVLLPLVVLTQTEPSVHLVRYLLTNFATLTALTTSCLVTEKKIIVKLHMIA